MTLHVAIIGSGPAGYYTAEACQKLNDGDVRIDIIDKLPTPYGLIRAGVAPDHQSIKAVYRRYEKTALSDNVRFVGNLGIGEGGVSMAELRANYDAVVLATGAPTDRPLGIPGEDLPGVFGSAAFVGWYNGHPDFVDLAPPLDGDTVAVIGNGNVAIDCARILAKTPHEFDGIGHRQARRRRARSNRKSATSTSSAGAARTRSASRRRKPARWASSSAPRRSCRRTPSRPKRRTTALEPGLRKVVASLREFAAPSRPTPRSRSRCISTSSCGPSRCSATDASRRCGLNARSSSRAAPKAPARC